MIAILDSAAYRGLSAHLGERLAAAGMAAQPAFVGRVVWAEESEPEEVVVKLYEADSCGVANEVIGFIVNALRGVRQPRRGGVLFLSPHELPDFQTDFTQFIDPHNDRAACWITSFVQNAKPFHYVRKLSSLSHKQSDAFYQSLFCRRLAAVDYVTGNSDRHEGNFLYEDDLKYLAIDQGCVGGGKYWHTAWPDANARNELVFLARQHLSNALFDAWRSAVIVDYEEAASGWDAILADVASTLTGLLTREEVDTIVDYMRGRATGPAFAQSCGTLI